MCLNNQDPGIVQGKEKEKEKNNFSFFKQRFSFKDKTLNGNGKMRAMKKVILPQLQTNGMEEY